MNTDLILSIILIVISVALLIVHPLGLDAPSAAGLAGALFGGAALLFGNWINRLNHNRIIKEENEKLKALIAAELVNVAAGLVQTKQLVDSAIVSLKADGSVSTGGMGSSLRHQMPFTEGLGTRLVELEIKAVDAIVVLRSQLAITKQEMDEVSASNSLSLHKAESLSNSLSVNMEALAKTFEQIAPNRKSHLSKPNSKPILVTEWLRQKAKQPSAD